MPLPLAAIRLHTRSMTSFNGDFWVEGGDRVPGTLTFEDEGSFVVTVDGYLMPPKQVIHEDGRTTFTGAHDSIVADFAPRTVFGDIVDGPPMTLFSAHMEPVIGFKRAQRFSGNSRLVGAHIDDEHVCVNGIRWAWNGPLMSGSEDNATEIDGGYLPGRTSQWVHEGRPGLSFTPTVPTSLQVLLRDVQSACSQLIGLWCGRWRVPAVPVTEVLVDGQWCAYEGPESDDPRRVRSELQIGRAHV